MQVKDKYHIVTAPRILFASLALILIGLFFFVKQSVQAANPQLISFQGKVVNADGTNVTNGAYNFDFILWDDPTGGTNRWQELTKSVTVTDGVFQTYLGSATALPNFNTYPSLYLAVRFNADAAGYMSPRVQLASVPYALNSDTLGGIASSGFANAGLTNLAGVAINTALLPGVDNTIDLGSTAFSFRTLYADTSALTPLLDRASAGALSIGTGGASAATSIIVGSSSVTSMTFTTDNNSASDFSFTGGATFTNGVTFSSTTIFNGLSTFNTDSDFTFAGTENINVINTTGSNAVDLLALTLTNNDAGSAAQRGLVITNADSTSVTESGITIDNADTTSSSLTDAILITSTGVNNGIADAIDVSDGNITNALNVGANTITGAGYSVTSTASGLTLNSTSANLSLTTTTSGDITLNPFGNVILSDLITDANAVLYTTTAGVVTRVVETETASQCLLSGAGASGIPVWGSCGGGGTTLDSAYTAGNTIGTDSASNVIINLADVATPTEVTINNLDASGTNALQIDNSTTLTNGLFIEQSASGTLTNGIQIAGSAGTITSGLTIADGAGAITTGITLSGTFTNLFDSPTLDISNAGAITTTVAGGASSLTNTASGSGLVLSGVNGAVTASLRIVSNTNAWADSVTSSYFQATNTTNNNLTFMGGGAGTDTQLTRLQFASLLTQVSDTAFTSTPAPTALFGLVSNVASKVALLVDAGTTDRTVDVAQFDVDVNSASVDGLYIDLDVGTALSAAEIVSGINIDVTGLAGDDAGSFLYGLNLNGDVASAGTVKGLNLAGSFDTGLDLSGAATTTDIALDDGLTISQTSDNDLDLVENSLTLNIDFGEATASTITTSSASALTYSSGGLLTLDAGSATSVVLTDYITDANAVLYTSTTGVLTRVVETETGSQCLLSGAGASGIPVWGSCAGGTTPDFDAVYAQSITNTNLNMEIDDIGGLTFDLTTTGDFIIRDGTTPYVTFDDSGGISIAPNGTSDLTLALDDDSSLILNGTITSDGFLQDINLTLGADADVDTISGLNIDVTSALTGDADILSAINIGSLASADGTVLEHAIRIGSGWDANLYFNDTTANIGLASGGTLTLGDGNFNVRGGTTNIASQNDVLNVNKDLTPNVTDNWSTGTAGGTARRFHSSVLYNGKMYSWGGSNGSNLDTVNIYDIANNSWSTGTAGGTARYAHSSVLYNGKIYSWGGTNGSNLNTVDIYDIASNSWSTGTAGGTARESHSSVLYNGKIYSWGGTNGSNLNTVDIYDIANNSWSTGTAGGTARNSHSSVLYNGKMYSWGGTNGSYLNTVDIYDIASNSWSTGTAGGTARQNHSSVLYNGKIYSWGGTNGSALNTVNIYDIANNSWSTGTAGGTARYAHSSVIYNGKVYSWAGLSGSNTVDIYDIGNRQSILTIQENGQDGLSFQTGSSLFLSSGRLGILGGNVGIGTATPNAKLEVVGDIVSKGTLWVDGFAAAPNTWQSIAYGAGRFVAVSNDGSGNRVMTSDDGIAWVSRTSAANNSWTSVTYGNGVFVAVASSGTNNRVMTSPNGINWTVRTSAGDHAWQSVTYGAGKFVAVACGISATTCNATAGSRVMTSPDGITWTIQVSAADYQWQSVTFGQNISNAAGNFVAVANSGTGNRVMSSPDGVTWTARTTPVDNNWTSVTFGNGQFVAVSNSGTGDRVMTSSNGTSGWTSRTSVADSAWSSVTFGNGIFVAVSSGTSGVMTSSSGTSGWSLRTTPSMTYNEVIYGNGMFVAAASSDTAYSGRAELNVIAENAEYSSYLYFTQADDTDATDAQGGLNIHITSASGDADALVGINISDITAGTATESAIQIGSGWDQSIVTTNSADLKILTNGTGDVIFSLDDDSSLISNGTVTNTGFLTDMNLTLGNDADVDTVSALNIDVTSAATGDADVLYGINIANLSAADSTVNETALRIGTGWNEAIRANGHVTIGAQADATSGSYTLTNGTAGAFGAETAIDGAYSQVVYNGKVYVGTKEPNNADIYRYDGGGTWTRVTTSSVVGGEIIESDGTDIDAIVLAVFDGKLYAGTQTGANTSALYSYNGSTWIIVSTTRGTFGAETARDSITDITTFNGRLYLAVSDATVNLGAVYRADILTSAAGTFTRINLTIGECISTDATDIDSGVLQVYGGRLYWGVVTGSTTGRVCVYDGLAALNGFYVVNGVQGTFATGTTGQADVNSMTVYNGMLYVGVGTANLSNIYALKPGISPTAASLDPFIKTTATSGRIDAVNDLTDIDSIPALRVYNGRLYAGSSVGAAGNLGAMYEYNDDNTWSLIGARGTFGAQSGVVDGVNTLLEYNGTLYIGTDDSGGVASVYTWSKTSTNSFGLRFEGVADSNNFGAISFVSNQSAVNGVGHTGVFQFSSSVSMISGAFDYAEDYPTLDSSLVPGEPVAVDPRYPEHVKRAGKGETVLGVVSENPGFRLSSTALPESGARWIPIALVGRVPVLVTTHDGTTPILPGDTLAVSDLPGVLEKATSSSGVVVGTALAGYDSAVIGKVSLYVQPGLKGIAGGIDASQISELIEMGYKGKPFTLRPSDTAEAGAFIIQDENGEDMISFDNQGNAHFAGTLTADKIKASQIEGLEILTDKISSLSAAVAASEQSSSTTEVVGAQAEPQSEVTPADNTIDMSDVTFQSVTVTLNLNVFGTLTASGALVVEGDATFNGLVEFAGRATFNNDTGGFATINVGQREVEVQFEEAYESSPSISATIKNGVFASYSYQEIKDEQNKITGFKILLKQPAEETVEFSWIAISIKDARSDLSETTLLPN